LDPPGEYITGQLADTYDITVKARGTKNDGYTPGGAARVFAMNCHIDGQCNGDPDLGSPNESCGGREKAVKVKWDCNTRTAFLSITSWLFRTMIRPSGATTVAVVISNSVSQTRCLSKNWPFWILITGRVRKRPSGYITKACLRLWKTFCPHNSNIFSCFCLSVCLLQDC
jgi:hypothetical protein